MKRMTGVIVGVAAIAVLSGCAAEPTPPDPEKVSEWMAQWEGKDTLGTVAVLSGASGVADEDASEGIISVDFEAPTTVAELEFSCFGAETMSVQIWLSGDERTTAVRTEGLVCADSPHRLDDTADGATKLSVNAYDGHAFGAWALVARE